MTAAVIAHLSVGSGEWHWYEPAVFASPIAVIVVLLWYLGWTERRDADDQGSDATAVKP